MEKEMCHLPSAGLQGQSDLTQKKNASNFQTNLILNFWIFLFRCIETYLFLEEGKTKQDKNLAPLVLKETVSLLLANANCTVPPSSFGREGSESKPLWFSECPAVSLNTVCD